VKNFQEFAKAFVEDVALQKQYTANPLKRLETVQERDAEPRSVESKLDAAQVRFPLIPGANERAQKSLTVEATAFGPKGRVRLAKPDTDYLVIYLFEHSTCWKLVRIEDWSL
jgi:hypothetical protein